MGPLSIPTESPCQGFTAVEFEVPCEHLRTSIAGCATLGGPDVHVVLKMVLRVLQFVGFGFDQ